MFFLATVWMTSAEIPHFSFLSLDNTQDLQILVTFKE